MHGLLRAAVVTLVATGGCITFDATRDGKNAISLTGVSGQHGSGGVGAGCTSPNECASGFCADGVCCNEACDDSCARCDGANPGTCHAVSGQPTGSRTACAASNAMCAGTCDGVSRQCSYPAASTRCGASCDGTCAGDGSCAGAGAGACPNGFACAASSCATACASNSDCAANFECVAPPGCTRVAESDCFNGVDDNGDGLADCQDPSCLSDKVECVDDPIGASAIGYLSSDTTCVTGYAPTTLNGSPGPNSGTCASACSCTPPPTQHAMSLDDYPTDSACGGASTHGSNAYTLSSDNTFRICIYSYGPGITTDAILLVSQGSDTLASGCSSSNLSGSSTPPTAAWGTTGSFCAATSKNSTCPTGKSCVAKQAQKHCALYPAATACTGTYSSSSSWFADFGADSRTCSACNTLGCTATPQTLDSVNVYPHSTACPTLGAQYLINTITTIGIDWPNAVGSCWHVGEPAACSNSSCFNGTSQNMKTFTATSNWSGGSCSLNSAPVITGGALAGSGAKTTCCEP